MDTAASFSCFGKSSAPNVVVPCIYRFRRSIGFSRLLRFICEIIFQLVEVSYNYFHEHAFFENVT